MAEDYDGEITFSPTNTSKRHVVQLPQNSIYMLAEDSRHPKMQINLF